MILEMRDICKDYPMGKSVAHILKNVNLDVEEGEYLAIMGPSGSGKTTLMNLIGCLDVPTSGSYLLGGRDVTTCNNKQLAEATVSSAARARSSRSAFFTPPYSRGSATFSSAVSFGSRLKLWNTKPSSLFRTSASCLLLQVVTSRPPSR